MVSRPGKSTIIDPDIDGKYVNPEVQRRYGMQSKETFFEKKYVFAPVVSARPPEVGVVPHYALASYLSVGECHNVDGLSPAPVEYYSTCFHRVLAALGFKSPHDLCRVADLEDRSLLELQALGDKAQVYYSFTTDVDRGNHVALVSPQVKSTRIEMTSTSKFVRESSGYVPRVMGVTSLVQFFNSSNAFRHVQFYSGQDDENFGSDMLSAAPFGQALPSARATAAGGNGTRVRDPSVSVPDSRHGLANVTSGVVRPRRRVVAAKAKFNPSGYVQKTYVSSSGVQFNNLNEIYLDAISRDYAQDILVELFELWGVSYDDPDVAKYCEDLVWAFIIATTASNKADYRKEFEVPHKNGSVTVSFDVFSRLLAEAHGKTRRQFARGVADDMRRYISEPENVHLLPRLADRAGCDPQMASLAFDGSTHCTGLTSSELSFTKLLEGRNLFEDDRVLADGASQRLMQGMSSGPRSMVSR